MSNKQTLQSQISQLKGVLASPKTDGTTRKILESGLKKAEAKLDELEKAEKLESSKKELTPKQEEKVEEVKKETKTLAQTLKEKVAKAKQKIATTTPKATKKGGARSVAKAKDLAKQRRSTQKKQSLSDKDIESDANRYAINKTKRKSQGGRANQYGTKAENKGGIYYEKRENRYDVQNKRYAKLEDGGYTDFGYHVINDEVTLKNGKKVFVTKGRYYSTSDLNDGRISGVYYESKDMNRLISADEIKFPLNKMADGGDTRPSLEQYKKELQQLKMQKANAITDIDKFRIDKKIREVSNIIEHREKMADGGAIQTINGTQFSTEDLSGMFAQGGMTEHGLEIGDVVMGISNEPYSIIVRNNGMEMVVDLNEGTRMSNNQGTRFASRSMQDPMVVRTQFEEMEFEYADGGAINYVNGTEFSTEDLSGMFLKGGMLNKKVNEELKNYLGNVNASPMNQWQVKTILQSALTDANFHSASKKVDDVFPNAMFVESPIWSKLQEDFLKDRLENKGREIARMSEYDGDEIINAIAFYVSMNMGRPLGQKVESLKNSMANGGVIASDGKTINVGDLVMVNSKRNKQYKVKEINGKENVKVVYNDGSEYVTTTSDLKKFVFASSRMGMGGQIMYYRDEDKIKDASGRELKIGDSVIVSGRGNNVAIVKDIDEKESKMGGFGVKVVYKDGSEDRVSVGDLKYMSMGGGVYSKDDSIGSAKRVANAMRSKMMKKKS